MVMDMKKEPILKTKRMLLRPMSDGEIETLIAASDSEELRTAYGEMLAGCRRDPANRIWYAPWKMTLKSGGAYLGDLGFKGPARENAVEINDLRRYAFSQFRIYIDGLQGKNVILSPMEPFEVSSTALRKAIAMGADTSAYLAPDVENYIHGKGLYGYREKR